METCAELEKTKPRLGFAGDVETTYQHYHQQHRINQRPTNLSPRSSSLWTELTSTFSPQDLEFLASLILSPSTYGNHQRQHQSPTSSIPHCDGDPLKRPRFNLGNAKQTPPFPSEGLGRFNGVGGMGRPGGDNLYMGGELMPGRGGVFPPYFGPNGTRDIGFGLPPNASKTLFVEGLPSDCSMREVAHIFRPFPGYKEVRLVTKDSKHRNGDRIILCFVDFENPACAATARNALQGYRMDEEERDSKILRIQFSRNPGPRPGQRGGRR
ncbi:nucleotide binding [Raphanus sativus]|nr:nucleotide binding [Raphanus sativus]